MFIINWGKWIKRICTSFCTKNMSKIQQKAVKSDKILDFSDFVLQLHFFIKTDNKKWTSKQYCDFFFLSPSTHIIMSRNWWEKIGKNQTKLYALGNNIQTFAALLLRTKCEKHLKCRAKGCQTLLTVTLDIHEVLSKTNQVAWLRREPDLVLSCRDRGAGKVAEKRGIIPGILGL